MGELSRILCRASNEQFVHKKIWWVNLLFKLSYLILIFSLSLGYLNPAFNKPALAPFSGSEGWIYLHAAVWAIRIEIPQLLNVNFKIVKSTLFKRVLTDVSAILPSTGYKTNQKHWLRLFWLEQRRFYNFQINITFSFVSLLVTSLRQFFLGLAEIH